MDTNYKMILILEDVARLFILKDNSRSVVYC